MERPPTPSLSTSLSQLTITTLWHKLSEFVMLTCYNRDESHGYKHMEAVAHTSTKILESMLDTMEHHHKHELRIKVITVAWLHDVADHKYNDVTDANVKIRCFLSNIFDNSRDIDEIFRVIDYISFQKEQQAINKDRPLNFEQILGPKLVLVRHIVSDADKLEALGKIGFERCIQYSMEVYKSQTGCDISCELLKARVHQHAHEKLLRLKDEFIRTPIGKFLAQSLHEELVVELNKM